MEVASEQVDESSKKLSTLLGQLSAALFRIFGGQALDRQQPDACPEGNESSISLTSLTELQLLFEKVFDEQALNCQEALRLQQSNLEAQVSKIQQDTLQTALELQELQKTVRELQEAGRRSSLTAGLVQDVSCCTSRTASPSRTNSFVPQRPTTPRVRKLLDVTTPTLDESAASSSSLTAETSRRKNSEDFLTASQKTFIPSEAHAVASPQLSQATQPRESIQVRILNLASDATGTTTTMPVAIVPSKSPGLHSPMSHNPLRFQSAPPLQGNAATLQALQSPRLDNGCSNNVITVALAPCSSPPCGGMLAPAKVSASPATPVNFPLHLVPQTSPARQRQGLTVSSFHPTNSADGYRSVPGPSAPSRLAPRPSVMIPAACPTTTRHDASLKASTQVVSSASPQPFRASFGCTAPSHFQSTSSTGIWNPAGGQATLGPAASPIKITGNAYKPQVLMQAPTMAPSAGLPSLTAGAGQSCHAEMSRALSVPSLHKQAADMKQIQGPPSMQQNHVQTRQLQNMSMISVVPNIGLRPN